MSKTSRIKFLHSRISEYFLVSVQKLPQLTCLPYMCTSKSQFVIRIPECFPVSVQEPPQLTCLRYMCTSKSQFIIRIPNCFPVSVQKLPQLTCLPYMCTSKGSVRNKDSWMFHSKYAKATSIDMTAVYVRFQGSFRNIPHLIQLFTNLL